MKAIAVILLFCMTGLFVQPSFFPLKVKEENKMDCCKTIAGKNKVCQKHKKNDCCNSDMCNPFTGQCPICVGAAIITEPISLYASGVGISVKEKFAPQDEHLISHYIADILRPPDMA